MGAYLLVAVGVIFVALFALNNLIKTLFRRPKIGFLDILLTFMTTLVLLVGLILTQTAGTRANNADPRVGQVVTVAGAALAVFSLLILLLEIFRPQRLKGSRGVLGMYTGLLLMLASVGVPIAATTFTTPEATPVLQAVSAQETDQTQTEEATASTATPRASATSRPTSTPENTDTPQPTDPPRATATASATRFHYSTRTPTPTPTLVTPCVASVEYNLRLRVAPNRDSETLLTIPYGTTIELYAHGDASENGARWWYTTYEGQQGWVDGQFMLVSAACDSLPAREAS